MIKFFLLDLPLIELIKAAVIAYYYNISSIGPYFRGGIYCILYAFKIAFLHLRPKQVSFLRYFIHDVDSIHFQVNITPEDILNDLNKSTF